MNKQTPVEFLQDALNSYLQKLEVKDQAMLEMVFNIAKRMENKQMTNEVSQMFSKIDGLGLTKGLRQYMEDRYQTLLEYQKKHFGANNE